MADFPDAPDVKQIVESKQDDRLSRMIAVAIVLVTLAAAVTAWLQAAAGRDDDEAAVRAERLASQTLGTIARSKALAELRVQRTRLAEERGRRADSLARHRAFGVGAAAETRALERGWRRAARATERTTERIEVAEGIEPVDAEARGDPAFPNAYLVEAGREGDRLGALRDAANREGDRAEEQVGAYGVALAIFAVSVFLLGYALTPYGRPNRSLFAGTAVALSLTGAAWTLSNVVDPPDRPPEEAAAAFASARVAVGTGEAEEALAELDRAIELREGYPLAHTVRGLVRAGVATADAEQLPAIAAEGDLRAARRDLDRAIELDPQDIDAVLGLASVELLLGIREDDAEALARAALAAGEAIEQDPPQPTARYLLAEALLALGDEEEGGRALAEATSRTALADDGERPRDEGGRRALVAGALTTLDQLVVAGRLDSGRGERLKGSVIAASWPEVGPPLGDGATPPADADEEPGESPFERLELDVTPAGYELSWPADAPGGARPPAPGAPAFDAEANSLAVVLYALDPSGDWVVVPELSGPARRDDLRFDPSSDRALVRRERFDVTVPPRCLPAGEYRAEVYVDGALVGGAVATDPIETGGAHSLDGLALLVCSPPGWSSLPDRRAGVVDGIVAPDGEAGLLAVRVPAAAAPGRGRRGTREALQAGIRLLEPLIRGRIERRRRTTGPFIDATVAPTLLMGTSEGGAVAAAARLSEDEIVVGAVYGPPALFEPGPDGVSSQSAAVFDSVSDRF